MIAKEDFLKKYNISEDSLINSGMTWDDYCAISDDFEHKIPRYEKIRDDFVKDYLTDFNKDSKPSEEEVKIHAVRTRVKDSEHLIGKIIRKKEENDRVYKLLDRYNYEKFVRDLIGIRCLLVFKKDWVAFHHYILTKFENDETKYVRDALQDFDEDENHYYLAEPPKVHLRNGDKRKIYETEKLLAPDQVLDGKIYRAVHYIIKYKGIYLEIQLRTLFEEGWSEIDHAAVYPYYKQDPVLREYTELLNRLSGLADEMGDFFERLKKLEVEHLERTEDDERKDSQSNTEAKQQKEEPVKEKDTGGRNTAIGCLEKVLQE